MAFMKKATTPHANGSTKVGFDRVIVPGPNGGVRELNRREYEALPLPERISYIVEGKAQFFLNGRSVTSWEALKDS